MYLVVPSSLMDTINHFLCHLVSCTVVPAARQFPCHPHVHNVLYTYTTNKPTRHHYFTPLIITFTTLLLVDGTVKYNSFLVNFQFINLLHHPVPDIAAFTVTCLYKQSVQHCTVGLLMFFILFFF